MRPVSPFGPAPVTTRPAPRRNEVQGPCTPPSTCPNRASCSCNGLTMVPRPPLDTNRHRTHAWSKTCCAANERAKSRIPAKHSTRPALAASLPVLCRTAMVWGLCPHDFGQPGAHVRTHSGHTNCPHALPSRRAVGSDIAEIGADLSASRAHSQRHMHPRSPRASCLRLMVAHPLRAATTQFTATIAAT